ncbi:MAG: outer membrane beta-barrel protein [Legionella sp.]|jgi:opacity protein-like surface antigen
MNIKLFSAALLATSIASAATPIDGWYASVFGGYSYLPDNVSAVWNGLFFNGTTYDNGYNVGGRVGYQSNPIRYELEYTYLTATNSGFAIDFVPQTDNIYGNSSGNVIMANIYYDFPDMLPAISPFLGVGIGYASLQASLSSTAPFGGGFVSISENMFSYQATVGMTYNFAENYAMNLSYRFLATSQGGDFGRVFQADMANIGGVFRFDKGSYK